LQFTTITGANEDKSDKPPRTLEIHVRKSTSESSVETDESQEPVTSSSSAKETAILRSSRLSFALRVDLRWNFFSGSSQDEVPEEAG
jgi:hypothetical protein